MTEKTYTAAQREKATTMADGSYPIDNVADLKRAIQAFGRGNPSDSRKAAIKAWIKKRARALGATDQLPAEWRSNTMDLEQQLSTDRIEARSVAFTDVDTSNDGWSFTGYGAVFDVDTDLGEFTESMARGSFRKALSRNENVPMLMEHNPTLPVLATTGGGTLRLSEDTKGLKVEADIAKHYIGEAVRELVKRGDIRGMSVGFVSGKGLSRIENRGGKLHRSILDFKKLLDVSPTWEPAYPGTSAELRSLRALQMAEGIEQVQQLLTGAASQLEDGAPAEEIAEPGEPSDEQDAKCDKCGATLEEGAEHECAGSEAPSGVGETRSLLAARKRRLALLGVTLP